MKKFVLLCTLLAACCCLALAKVVVNDDAEYAAAKDRYYAIIERIDAGTATRAEVIEIGDLCQVYGWDLPAALMPAEAEPENRDGVNLDQAGPDCDNAVDIPGCPFSDSGNLDGDDDCSVYTTPYGDLFYRFTPPFTGRYQMRLQTATYQGSIRIVKGSCCTGSVTRTISSNAIGSDCETPTTGITYLGGLFSSDTTYWIVIGTTGSNYTVSYQFDLWCVPCPNLETGDPHGTCAEAQEIACGDSILGYTGTGNAQDWYKVTISEPESIIVSVVGRELGHCISGLYPGAVSNTYDGPVQDARVAIYRGCNIPADSITFDDDGTHGYVTCQYDAKVGICAEPGTYYIKVGSATTSPRTGWYVLKVDCSPCDIPVWACCLPGGDCANLTQNQCTAAGGTWKVGVTCENPTACLGEDCATAIPVPSLPYYDTRTTCGFVDNYNATCLNYYDGGPDVLYTFTVEQRVCVTCSLTNVTAGAYPGLGVFDGCPDVGVCIAQKGASSGPIGTSCLVLEPGHTYYIMVDNWPSPPCVNAYTLEIELCDCPIPCEEYVLCGSPGEVESNNTCPPPAEQAEIGCDMTVYGLHCPASDNDFWKVVVPPMTIMTLKVYTGPNCDVNPPVGLYARYYNDLCASPSTGSANAIVLTNNTTDPLVKYLEVYDSGALTQVLYKVVATCCEITDYCANPIYTGAGIYGGGYYWFADTVNTCCATNPIATVWSTGCGSGSSFTSGPDVIFKFILATPGVVSCSVRVIGASGDAQFMMFTDCANPSGTCVASRDATVYPNWEVVNGLSLPADTYYVSVSYYSGTSCGDMEIRLSSDVPLPVELAGDVIATAGDETVTLRWATASETDNAEFQIVRDSRVVGRVNGAGTSPARHDYSWTENGLTNGTLYTYTLRSVDINGNARDLATVSATPSFGAGEVSEYALHQNYPNPFNPTTRIAFDLLENGVVTLKVYNLMGQEVRTVVNGTMPKGRHIVMFDSGDLASGIYLYRLEVNGFVAEKKMLLMK